MRKGSFASIKTCTKLTGIDDDRKGGRQAPAAARSGGRCRRLWSEHQEEAKQGRRRNEMACAAACSVASSRLVFPSVLVSRANKTPERNARAKTPERSGTPSRFVQGADRERRPRHCGARRW